MYRNVDNLRFRHRQLPTNSFLQASCRDYITMHNLKTGLLNV